MSALYMSMSANEGDLQIEDDLAKGLYICKAMMSSTNPLCSSEDPSGVEIEDLFTVKKELRVGERCSLS